ncbi:MAG: diguanylate cyclase [Cyanobacteriota bacterium]
MQFNKKLITPENYLIITIISSIVIVLFLTLITNAALHDLIEKIELKSFDWRAQNASENIKPSDDIVLLVIDDISLQNAISHPEIGLTRWPWPRNIHSYLINYLKAAGAKAIVFDILFEGKEGNNSSNDDSDNIFINSVKKAENIYLALSFTYSKKSLQKYKEKENFYAQNILNTSSNQLKDDIKKFAIYPPIKDVSEIILNSIEFYNVSNILHGLLINAKDVGSVNLPYSMDGIARTVRPISIFNGEKYPSLPLAVYLSLNPDVKIELEDDKFILGERQIALDEEGAHFVNWYGPPATFKYYRALDVILAQKVIENGGKNPLAPDVFKDKIVVIGLTATATDILPTPMAGAYPGPEFLATTISNYMISDKFISKLSSGYTILITIFFCLLAGTFVLSFKSGLNGISLAIMSLFAYVYLCVHLYVHNYIWLSMVFPSLIILFTITITFVAKYITTRKAYEDTYKLATTDGLTGLHNHRFFQENLFNYIQRANRFKYQVTLLLIDIDNFKSVNDTYGHRAGDKILKEVSDRIISNVRATDIVARYGGEEIVIILDNTPLNNGMIAANKLLRAINSESFVLGPELSLQVTVSIGISEFPANASSPPELIEVADQGLYYAKEHGKNRIGFRKGEFFSYENENLKEKDVTDIINVTLRLDRETFEVLQEKSNCRRGEDIAEWIINQFKEPE